MTTGFSDTNIDEKEDRSVKAKMSWKTRIFNLLKPTEPTSIKNSLRPFNIIDQNACKTMKGTSLSSSLNPGIRIEKAFLSSTDESDLLKEVESLRSIAFKSQATLYLNSIDQQPNTTSKQENKLSVDSYRVTGRPEASHQTPASWGYGDDFKLDMVPTALRRISERIREHSEYNLLASPLRDITINYRSNAMFKLDPHIDPAKDGGNVFVLG